MRHERDGRYSPLWVAFSTIIFITLVISSLVFLAVAIILVHTGVFAVEAERLFRGGPILLLVSISVTVGTSVSLFVGKRILSPISAFGKASIEVAKGNFNVELDERGRIREILDMARSFNFMVRELSRVETLRNDFVDNVSHEFRTPISAIEGYATLLMDKRVSEAEREEYIRLIAESANQLSTLTTNILKLSKLENQEVVMDKKPFRLDEQIREAVLLLEGKWSEKELELDIDLEKTTYVGNRELLNQVWLNLIDNAVKFTAPGGSVTIRLTGGKDGAHVTVTDSGKGMAEEERSRVFEKFYQGDNARTGDGNGLGLALVARIVDLCQGTVEVTSAEGQGSVFSVFLPAETRL